MTKTIRLIISDEVYHGLTQLKGILGATTWKDMADKLSAEEFLNTVKECLKNG